MVQIRLPVDLAVLCTIVDRLCGLTIMTTRYRGLHSLHGVLLPRTWIPALWEDFFKFKDRMLPRLRDLFQTTEKLLKDIYSGEYQKHATIDPRNRGEFDQLYCLHQVTLRRDAGLKEHGTKLLQRSAKILTRLVCRTHVSVLPLEA